MKTLLIAAALTALSFPALAQSGSGGQNAGGPRDAMVGSGGAGGGAAMGSGGMRQGSAGMGMTTGSSRKATRSKRSKKSSR